MMRCLALLVALLVATALAGSPAPVFNSTVTVSLPLGDVLGGVNEFGSFFLGIPFAAAPVGPLRYAPPAVRPAWSTPHNGTTWGPTCPQVTDLPGPNAPVGIVTGEEDCLNLDVYVPPSASAVNSSNLPVLYWVPGGCFWMGTGDSPVYDGQRMASMGNVIVVAINYRLGGFGFLRTDADVLVGNYGMLDMVWGLEWVRDNIAAFGGDPTHVVIDGESSGATAIATLITMPSVYENNLITGAIIQSDPMAAGINTAEFAQKYGNAYAGKVNCSTTDLPCLRAVPLNASIAAQMAVYTEIMASLELLEAPLDVTCGWGPNVDGTIIPEQPLQAVLDGRWAKVPLLVGTTRDEGSLFAAEYALGVNNQTSMDLGVMSYAEMLLAFFGPVDAVRVDAEYPHTNNSVAWLQLTDVITRWAFRCPLREMARAAAQDVPVYAYEFVVLLTPAEAQSIFGNFSTAWSTACTGLSCHGEDVMFTFGLMDSVLPGTNFSRLSNDMMGYWSNFVATSNPNTGATPPPLAWPLFNASSDVYMELGLDGLQILSDLDSAACDFFDSIGYTEGIFHW